MRNRIWEVLGMIAEGPDLVTREEFKLVFKQIVIYSENSIFDNKQEIMDCVLESLNELEVYKENQHV